MLSSLEPTAVKTELVLLLESIEKLITQVKQQADRLGCGQFEIMDPNSQLLMAPLVVAKSQVIHSLVLLSKD